MDVVGAPILFQRSWQRHDLCYTAHRHNLPPHVYKALLPLYECLSEKKLVERCQCSKTQNSNESLQSLTWALAPKHHPTLRFRELRNWGTRERQQNLSPSAATIAGSPAANRLLCRLLAVT
ncbi:hypothetical protein HPB47_024746 [Ixodes persulcatus]|uniref:Uncharacterized protein n=1 Tax=Ixodes persulcatus TaxID=34615 RepID=A0AC60Q5Q2_IXOPE|nr:hypothetical protein HPB47_024746 [Ixodes persulcatus]